MGVQTQTSCEACSSSDARAIYDDGHSYCFSCKEWFAPEGEERRTGTPKEPTDVDAEGSNNPFSTKVESSQFIEGAFQPLNERGLRIDTLRKFDYSVAIWKGQGIHIANYRGSSGDLVAQHLRFANKDFIWNGDFAKVELYGQHLYGAGGKRLIITEGEIDCLTIAQCFNLTWPVVSIPSGANSAKKAIVRHLEYCESFDSVVLAFDDDKAGREAIQQVAPLFTPGKVKIMKYSGYKDANELFTKLGQKPVVNEVFNANIYRPDGIINANTLWEEVKAPLAVGVELPYPILNKMLYGHRDGEITMLTAGSGLGKSTLAHEIGYHLLMEHVRNLGVMALEEPVRKATERYMSIDLNKPLHLSREGIDESVLAESFKRVTHHDRLWLYDHFGSTDIDNLLAKVRYMVVGLGVQTIILDHISIVVSGLDEGLGTSERKMIDILMTKLRSLVNETNCSIIAVVHLKRIDSNGKSWNEGKPVTLTALRGSASLEQLSDNVISVERNQQAEENANQALLRVLKCRHSGITGKADLIEYNIKTGRLLPVNPFGGLQIKEENFDRQQDQPF